MATCMSLEQQKAAVDLQQAVQANDRRSYKGGEGCCEGSCQGCCEGGRQTTRQGTSSRLSPALSAHTSTARESLGEKGGTFRSRMSPLDFQKWHTGTDTNYFFEFIIYASSSEFWGTSGQRQRAQTERHRYKLFLRIYNLHQLF